MTANVQKKHEYRVILRGEDGVMNKKWEFLGITAREFQVKLSELIKEGKLPKKAFKHWYKTGRVTIEKDGKVATIGG